jgi:hypothetical protein
MTCEQLGKAVFEILKAIGYLVLGKDAVDKIIDDVINDTVG